MTPKDAIALQNLLGMAAGHPVEIMRGTAALLGTRHDQYQVMPGLCSMDDPAVDKYWSWSLRNKKQLHASPVQAALQYQLNWREWKSTVAE